MDLKDIIFTLCKEKGLSGREYCTADKVSEIISEFTTVTKDKNGNVFAVMGNENGKKNILIDAHIDQIGFFVTKIDDNGFVKLGSVGGTDMRVMNDTLLTIHGKKAINAVVCCLPPHLSDSAEDKAVSATKLWADTGLSSEKVKELIEVGDEVTFTQEPMSLLGTRISSPALDDRCAVASLIKCAELLKNSKLKNKVTFLFSAKEEVGGMGAKTASFLCDCDEAIVVDVSFATQPDVSGDEAGKLGGGVMLGISPTLNKQMYNDIKNTAEKYDIPYQYEVMGETTGTNADDICISKGGIKTALISIPQRNMHTPAEIVDLTDVEAISQIIYRYITDVFDKEVL